MIVTPMLAEVLDLRHLPLRLNDDAWTVEQKVDGHRRGVSVVDGQVAGFNRRGEPADLPAAVRQAFTMAGDWTFDGELVGQTLWLFDLPYVAGNIGLTTPWCYRRQTLNTFHAAWNPGPAVRLLPWATTLEEKHLLTKRVLDNGGEGVVLKHRAATYRPGLRSHQCLKAKFWRDIDCVVTRTRVDGKDNLELGVYRDGHLVIIGECTALAGDGPTLQPGSVCTVKFLYVAVNDRLYQPTLPRFRNDKDPCECTWDQIEQNRVNKEVLP